MKLKLLPILLWAAVTSLSGTANSPSGSPHKRKATEAPEATDEVAKKARTSADHLPQTPQPFPARAGSDVLDNTIFDEWRCPLTPFTAGGTPFAAGGDFELSEADLKSLAMTSLPDIRLLPDPNNSSSSSASANASHVPSAATNSIPEQSSACASAATVAMDMDTETKTIHARSQAAKPSYAVIYESVAHGGADGADYKIDGSDLYERNKDGTFQFCWRKPQNNNAATPARTTSAAMEIDATPDVLTADEGKTESSLKATQDLQRYIDSLQLTVIFRHPDTLSNVKKLAKRGADIFAAWGSPQQTLLQRAQTHKHSDLIAHLEEAARVNIEANKMFHAFLNSCDSEAASPKDLFKKAENFEAMGADLTLTRRTDGQTLMHIAAASNAKKLCGYLKTIHPQLLEVKDRKGYMPLICLYRSTASILASGLGDILAIPESIDNALDHRKWLNSTRQKGLTRLIHKYYAADLEVSESDTMDVGTDNKTASAAAEQHTSSKPATASTGKADKEEKITAAAHTLASMAASSSTTAPNVLPNNPNGQATGNTGSHPSQSTLLLATLQLAMKDCNIDTCDTLYTALASHGGFLQALRQKNPTGKSIWDDLEESQDPRKDKVLGWLMRKKLIALASAGPQQ